MGTFSIWHWLLVLAIILIIFGAGKLPRVMGDFAKGIKAFRSGMKDENEKVEEQAKPADMGSGTAPGATQAAAKPAEAQRKEEKV